MIKSSKHDGRRWRKNHNASRDKRNINKSSGTGIDGFYNKEMFDDTTSASDEIPHFAKFDGQNIVIGTTSKSKQQPTPQRSGRSSSAHTGMRRGDFNAPGGGAYDAEAAATYKWAKHEATNSMSVQPSQIPFKDSLQKMIRKPSGGFVRSNSVGGQRWHKSARSPFTGENLIPQSGDYGTATDNNGALMIPPLQFRTRTRSQSPRLSSFKGKSQNGYHKRSVSAMNSGRPIIASSRKMSPAPKHKLSEEEEALKKNYASKKYTFQTPAELVTCRTIDLNSRVAFEKRRLVSVSDLHEAAKKMEPADDGKIGSTQTPMSNQLKKLSPSPYHVEIIETMNKITETRQLCWSLGVSQEADPFHGWQDDAINAGANIEESISMSSKSAADRARRRQRLLAKKRRDIAAKRVGGYKQIDPAKYIKEALPDHEPQLTNVKKRLPVRSDVGFPGATKEEIIMKQAEIAKEAQLEEISPRLVVLLTGDDVDLSPYNAIDEHIDGECMEQLQSSLPGIPFATKNLVVVKNQTAVSMVRKQPDVLREKNKTRTLKPDRNSIFSPPIDATSSSTEIWRPRPFVDRASGMKHTLAIPLDIKFGVGNIEPLVCTLSLYCLPKGRGDKKRSMRGKISEEFIFPAGNWEDMLQEKAGKMLAKQFGMDISSKSERERGRKIKKAMFSFDPMALPSDGERDGKESLYLVMEVHKVVHQEACDAYLDHSKDPNAASIKRNTIGGLFFGGKSSSSNRSNSLAAEERAKTMFNAFGMNFLTPFCFGILPLFPSLTHDTKDHVHWPHGTTQTMQLFSQVDDGDESLEQFVDRLESIAEFIHDNPIVSDNLDISLSRAETDSMDSNGSTDSSAMLGNSFDDSKRTYRRGRKKKYKAPSGSGKSQVPDDLTKLCGAKFIDGSARFYTSLIGSDFSQALLQSPACLNLEFNGQGPNFPRLFVDPSGDSAIMMNPDQNKNSSPKRSNLIRLPPATIPSGYADSSEVREVLYLPPEADKQIDTNLAQNIRNPLNLLYIFPRMIKDMDKNGTPDPNKSKSYSVRIRLVQQEVKVDDKSGAINTTYRPDYAIYNPSLLGEPIIEAAYTKIPLTATSKRSCNMANQRMYLRDEIKIRLPNVLDGKHFIQFSLYLIEINSGDDQTAGLNRTLVAETLIPLSSSSTKESINGTKVSTVIPNGLHRIKLSEFQLDIQSRLVSHIHISDPAVAAVMRDFSELQHDAQKSTIIPYSKILSKASQEAIVNHFQPLFFMHIRSFFSRGKLVFSCSSRQAPQTMHNFIIIGVMKSLLELIRKVKKLADSGDDVIKQQINRLLKATLDDYDDFHFDLIHNKVKTFEPGAPRILTSDSEKSAESRYGGEIADNSFESTEDIIDRGSQDIAIKSNLLSNRNISKDERLRELYASLNHSSPITRKAYGISKIDIMKAEAELYEAGQVFSELADDDETIVTATTFQSQAFKTSTNPTSVAESYDIASMNRIDLRHVVQKDADNIATAPDKNDSMDTPLEKARQMARRVNIAAKVFISPCVAPEINPGGNANPNPVRKKLGSTRKIRQLQEKDPRIQVLRRKLSNQQQKLTKHLIYAGSDDEYDSDRSVGKSADVTHLPFPNGISCPLRGIRKKPSKIRWTLSSDPSAEHNRSPPYIYEIIIALWLHASTTEVGNSKNTQRISQDSFMSNISFLLPLCLKSLVLRCKDKNSKIELVPSTVLDMQHMQMLDPLVAHVAGELIRKINTADDRILSNVLISSDALLDFFLGLLAVVHPSQPSWLFSKYLKMLGDFEESNLDDNDYLNRIRFCRQLRLRAIERIAASPRFVALNYPFKYRPYTQYHNKSGLSWTQQTPSRLAEQIPTSPAMFDEMSPRRHWLAELCLNECFEICSLSCEAIVNKSIYRQKSANSNKAATAKQSVFRRRLPLSEKEIAHHESMAYHSITVVYDLILRRNATDSRFQSKEGLGRIAGMFLLHVVENSVHAGQWLSKLKPSHKVRKLWLLCVMYVLQEAPEVLIRNQFLSMCDGKSISTESKLVRFMKVLKLCSSSFQGFTDKQFSSKMSPWLMQESFNTISACAIVLVDECFDNLSSKPFERQRMTETVLELLLSIVAVPLSSVTLLRGLGAVSQVLDKSGATLFLDAVGDNLQHWGRMLFTMMNSTSLSVRSMAVDLTISLLGGVFKEGGCIDEVSQIFVTVLPEVVAREIALYSANKLVTTIDCVERCMWPLRRALADVEDADPVDDDRVDASLLPFLKRFCRICQAIIDGVIIEIRLRGEQCEIAGAQVKILGGKTRSYHDNGISVPLSWMFDADEESLFEAASYFSPETSPTQKIRWLMTLKCLHEVKGNWVEAAETLILCARTVADAIRHVKNIWRPSMFAQWNSVQENDQIMTFANEFLEPLSLQSMIEQSIPRSDSEMLPRPTITSFGKILTIFSKEAVKLYDKENSMVSLSYSRLQGVLKIVMDVVEDHVLISIGAYGRKGNRHHKQNSTEETAALRKASASINELVTKLAERLHLLAGEDHSIWKTFSNEKKPANAIDTGAIYVRVILFGKKLHRFQESTTIPTFLDWGTPHVCRVPDIAVSRVLKKAKNKTTNRVNEIEYEIAKAFAEPLLIALREEASGESIKFISGIPDQGSFQNIESESYFAVGVVHSRSSTDNVQAKRFHAKKLGSQSGGPDSSAHAITEITVAKPFPCPLSRQPCLVTTELLSSGSFFD